MENPNLIDHSPNHPEAVAPIPSASRLVLIDNYDSFTWNVYQYLVLEGATVQVFRNDEISLEELKSKQPTQLVISPGPGHPDSDAGVSKAAIGYFAGKIPILGVCMGEQCIFSVFGGHVEVTGEILHGKTSPLRHDKKGIFAGLPQDLPVTRYHSLAGTHSTLPDCLELSSWIDSGPNGIIMGVRHRKYVVEGVQFHPESILTAEGRTMLKNFLTMKGGTWGENGGTQLGFTQDPSHSPSPNGLSHTSPDNAGKGSILETIFSRRKAVIESQKNIPSQKPSDLQAAYAMDLAPPQVSFPERLRLSPFTLSLMAEVKRASPSKGDIALGICAPAQARKYALAGASVISVLTEPDWFKGSVHDLRAVRQSLEGMTNRPAVLAKEFIFDEYQILEARLAGADTILLIVKMLEGATLRKLYQYSQKLGMEPLVEVNTPEEMAIAVSLGTKVVGVNNRNLTTFDVDLETTNRLMENISQEILVCALSGISGPADVEAYQSNGVGAVLVGEALMRAADPQKFANKLLGRRKHVEMQRKDNILVKICGTRTAEAADAAVRAGADMIGIILVQGRKRCVSTATAMAISNLVHSPGGHKVSEEARSRSEANNYFEHTISLLRQSNRALLVGVFQNQPLSYVLEQQASLKLDMVQLHGNEPVEWASFIPVPVLRRFGPSDLGVGKRGYHALPLLDSAAGGTGEKLDLDPVKSLLMNDDGLRVILAGGLNPDNVGRLLVDLSTFSTQIVAVDVSSGIETEGVQDIEKIRNFIVAAKSTQRTTLTQNHSP